MRGPEPDRAAVGRSSRPLLSRACRSRRTVELGDAELLGEVVDRHAAVVAERSRMAAEAIGLAHGAATYRASRCLLLIRLSQYVQK